MSYYMALHLSNFHHHIEVLDCLIHLISERIQEFNFCSMHCSFFFFFLIRVFFHGHWRLTGQQTTTSTRSRTFRHFFATLHVRWLSHIFNRNACICQTATRWDFPTLSNYHLIDWCCEVCFNLFTWWYDTRFLLQQSWYGKPVDSSSHQLSPMYYKQTD